MQVQIVKIPSIDEIKSIERMNDPNIFYNSFNDEDVIPAFLSVIDYEYKTCLGIMDTSFTRDQWTVQFLGMQLPSELQPLDDNYIVNLLGGKINDKDKSLIFENIENLMDIYERDYELLNFRGYYSHVIILSYNSRYYGHVYIVDSSDVEEEPISIIGIRSSIYNLLCENHGFQRVRNIAYYILDSYRSLAKLLNLEVITIENPIGSMVGIARKFGFDRNFYFETSKEPKIKVGSYTLKIN
jgi:hypothetical protein